MKKQKNSHMLSGSEFDELDAQLEHLIDEGEDLLAEDDKSLTPT